MKLKGLHASERVRRALRSGIDEYYSSEYNEKYSHEDGTKHNGTRNVWHLMKLPTIILGMPHWSLRIVNDKQQFTKPCSFGNSSCLLLPLELAVMAAAPGVVIRGLNRKTQDVSTAFWVESNAT